MPQEITDPEELKKVDALFAQKATTPAPEKSLLQKGFEQYKGLSESLAESIPGFTQAASAIEAPLRGMSYEQLVRNTRAAQQKAKQETPEAYQLGQGIAIAAPMAIPGGQGPLLAKAATAIPSLESKAIAFSKIIGPGMGLGYLNSAFDPTKNVLEETAMGAGIPMTFAVGGKVLKAVYNTGKNALEWGTGTLFNIPPSYIDKLRANPELIPMLDKASKEGKNITEINKKLENFFEKNPYRKRELDAYNKSVELLNNPKNANKKIDLKVVQNEINKVYENVPKVMGKSDEAFLKAADEYADRFRGKGKVNPQEAVDILRSIYADTSYGDIATKSSKENDLLKRIGGVLRSEINKQVPGYEKYSREMALNIERAKQVEKKYLNVIEKQVTVNPEKVQRLMESAIKPLKSESLTKEGREAQKYLKEFPELGSPTDLLETLRLQKGLGIDQNRKFNEGSNMMARFLGLGVAGSQLTEDPFLKGTLMASGLMAGAAAERQAGAMAGRAIQGLNAPEKIVNKMKNTRFGDTLKEALGKGKKEFTATHYLLLQRDPEYRKQIEEDTE